VGISAARPWRLQPLVTLASTDSIRRTPVATILDARITSRDTDAEAQRDPDRPMKRERRRATALPRRIEHRSPVPCSSTRPTNERPVRSPVSFAVPTNQTRTPQARLGRRLDCSRGESLQPINREPSEFVNRRCMTTSTPGSTHVFNEPSSWALFAAPRPGLGGWIAVNPASNL
jgi:hypothetical protein